MAVAAAWCIIIIMSVSMVLVVPVVVPVVKGKSGSVNSMFSLPDSVGVVGADDDARHPTVIGIGR